ncbi:MAG: DUF1616 domain-containing protein [Candidatus Bathyarchaeia archaeon]
MTEKKRLEKKILDIIEAFSPSTVKELLEIAHLQLSIPKEELLDIILNLQAEKRISLTLPEKRVQYGLREYFFKGGIYWFWIIIFSSIAATLSVFLIPEGSYPVVLLRYVLGSLFVLFLPGFSLIKALFPRKELDNMEKIALSLGLSLAIVPIFGLLLNYTPWGIRLTPITLVLLSYTLFLSLVAVIREYNERSLKQR